MSWMSYIDRIMMADGTNSTPVAEAAICGIDQLAVWASTPGLSSITPEEIKKLCGDAGAMRECGPKVGGRKCMLLKDCREEQEQHCLQLKASKTDGGAACCVGFCKTVLVIAMGGEGVGGGQLTPRVYDIVKYLRELGY